jgi:Spy/CpxP family protein refolding chaperone
MKKIIFLGVCALLLVPAAAYAGSHKAKEGRPDHHRSGRIMEEVIQELGLSQEQQEKIKELKEAMYEDAKDARAEKKQKYYAMKKELDKVDTDRATVDALIEELVGFERKKLQSRAQHVLAIKEVLSRAQFEALQHKLEIKEEVKKELWRMKKSREEGKASFCK